MRISLSTCGLVAALFVAVPPAHPAPRRAPLTLWYRQPAPKWEHSLPVGNGRLGATVFGEPKRERIVLNEDSLWVGTPRPDGSSNPEALKHLPEVRRLLFAGKPKEAIALAEEKMMG